MRKLARIVKVDNIIKHPNADTLDILTIGGWKVVAKSGLHQENDHVIYLEIDSFVPTSLAPFLTKEGKQPKEFEGVKGEVLKSIRLRGQISQGMVIPIRDTPLANTLLELGQDVSDLLGIKKYEKPLPASLAGNIRCHFPSVVPKTDAERIQNLSTELDFWKNTNLKFYVTEKLDGTSFSCMKLHEDIHVCSRNFSLYETAENTYWQIFRKYDLENVLKSVPSNLAIQGEIIGPGIQENQYGLSKQELYVFSVYDIDNNRYYSYQEMESFCNTYNLNRVPLVDILTLDSVTSIDSLLAKAEGTSVVGPKESEREGLVWRGFETPETCFKTISNKWLMKN
jgi:RNA ligase (TIGR02306 family)